jgi:hypothetical protein
MEIITNDFKKAAVQGQIIESTKQEKMKASAKKLGLFWGLAFASVFIPVFHFVLVPMFLIVGVVFFFQQMKHTHMAKDLVFLCPNCGKENKIEKMYFSDSARFRCQECSTQLILKS